MRTVLLIQQSQNEIGLPVDYDLSLARGIDDAKALYEWTKQGSEEAEFTLAYYDSSSIPLLEWLQLVITFKVVLDKEQIINSPIPNRLGFETVQLMEIVPLFAAKSEEDEKTSSSTKREDSEATFSEIEEDVEDNV